jgi:AcrR family transcriptional regulator
MATKTRPIQLRSRQTFERVLAAAGDLLAEVGIEQFSTNQVCKRANVTPPALYRYFPNKYALLRELARRLMEIQDNEVFAWIEAGGLLGATTEDIAARNLTLLRSLMDLTQGFPGGIWILRAMRAVPLMQEAQRDSATMVADRLLREIQARYNTQNPERLRLATWLSTGISSAVIEMALDGPEADREALLEEYALMIARYYGALG